MTFILFIEIFKIEYDDSGNLLKLATMSILPSNIVIVEFPIARCAFPRPNETLLLLTQSKLQ